ncbi:hypothetical protein MalM25_37320 [Planctomycetes bacterium MalM25]|nr:hypothetical protein MalM25_37320 [Planctomycetes bacterium MalM25]
MPSTRPFLAALCATLLGVGASQAAFIATVDGPNFSFGGDTTSASASIASAAIGMPVHGSLFGGNGVADPDTYVLSYTPGVDADNFSPAAGDLLGSTTGFGTELASGTAGGATGTYAVYITAPSSTNVNAAGSTFTITGDGAPLVVGPLDMNDGGTGADLDAGPAFVGGANNSWYKLGEIDLTAGVTYSVTMEAEVNSFVSQRLAGVMWEAQIPEPTSFALLALSGLALAARRR